MRNLNLLITVLCLWTLNSYEHVEAKPFINFLLNFSKQLILPRGPIQIPIPQFRFQPIPIKIQPIPIKFNPVPITLFYPLIQKTWSINTVTTEKPHSYVNPPIPVKGFGISTSFQSQITPLQTVSDTHTSNGQDCTDTNHNHGSSTADHQTNHDSNHETQSNHDSNHDTQTNSDSNDGYHY